MDKKKKGSGFLKVVRIIFSIIITIMISVVAIWGAYCGLSKLGSWIGDKMFGISQALEAEKVPRVSELVSLEPENNVSGGFITAFTIGVGGVESKQIYLLYAKENGGYIKKKADAFKTLIIETDNETPKYYECQIPRCINNKYDGKLILPKGYIKKDIDETNL